MMTRTTPSPRSAAAVTTAALALVLTACSSPEPEPAPAPSWGPVTQLAEEIFGSLEPDWDSQATRIEELAAECMAAQGFTYLPVDPNTGPETVDPEWEVEYETREWAELYGYGFSTDAWEWDAQYRAWIDAGGLEEEPDPNVDYVAGMSEAERQAFAVALWGEPTAGDEPPDWETGGCQGWARHQAEQELAEQDAWRGGAGLAILSGANGEVWDSTRADPRFADLNTRWAQCMAHSGYPDFSEPQDALDWVLNDMNAAQDDSGLTAEATSAERHAAWARIDERLAEIRPAEIELAVADFDCKVEVAYPQTMVAIAAEYEQEIYDANRTELEALREAFREWQGTQ